MSTHNNNTQTYDIAIIGGGPGGYVSAIKAAQMGAKVALFEADNVGGTCLNWGCIPTKSLLNHAHNWYQMKSKDIFSSSIEKIALDMQKLVKESRSVVSKLTTGVRHLLKVNNVDVYNHHASIQKAGVIKAGDHIIKAGDHIYTSRNIIIATGAQSRSHPVLKIDGAHILNAKHAMLLQEVPKTIAIVGAGVIGVEFASLFNALGSKVHLIEFTDKIMSFMDKDVITFMHQKLSQRGIEILTNASVDNYSMSGQVVQLKLKNGDALNVDKCLVAIGLTGNIHDLGLQNVNVMIDKNMQIITNEQSETNEPGVYAIGDVNSKGPWLAHRASEEGMRCVERILGHDSKRLDLSMIPGCVYSMPQIGAIGLTEDDALKAGLSIKIGKFPLAANGKALTKGDDGFIKLIIDADIGTIIGAHIVSNEATELISQLGIMMDLEGTCQELSYVFPHPTISEAVSEAILAAYKQAIHIPNA